MRDFLPEQALTSLEAMHRGEPMLIPRSDEGADRGPWRVECIDVSNGLFTGHEPSVDEIKDVYHQARASKLIKGADVVLRSLINNTRAYNAELVSEGQAYVDFINRESRSNG